MSNGVVLNHLSLPYAEREVAKDGFVEFLKVLKTCRKYGLKVLLVDESQDKSLMRVELATGYHVNDWLNQIKGNPILSDWGRLLRSLETKQPLFEQVSLDEINGEVEVGLTGEKKGNQVTLAAYWHEVFLASFCAFENWVTPLIPVWVLDMSNGEEEETDAEVNNLADEDSLKHHEALLCSRRNLLISTAIDIWNQRSEIFPSLTLLPDQIGSSLKTWSHREDVLHKARDALYVLELFSAKWKNSEYEDYRHDHLRDLGLAAEVTGESKSVNDDPKKRAERMFWLDDGRKVYCENHVKLSDGYRLHFYPDLAQKHIYVAYLGSHMRL